VRANDDKKRAKKPAICRPGDGGGQQLFQKAATIEGRSMATFVITHSREVARQVINQSNLIQLDAAQSRRFVEALLAPPRPPTAALKRAMARYRRDVTSI